MILSELIDSAENDTQPPASLNEGLTALWYARAGNWHKAHDLCDTVPDPEGSWIHAHLHRIEGDLGNAGYWYARAGKPQPSGQAGLNKEWEEIAEELL